MPIPAGDGTETPTTGAGSLRFPDTGSRYVFQPNGRPAAGAAAFYYQDAALTVPAEIYRDNNGTKGARVTPDTTGRVTLRLDANGGQATFWGPVSGADRLWMVVNGVVSVVDADYNARLDAVEAALGAGGTSGLTAHLAATTTVHGIADTSALETKSGAQTKATAAGNAAVASAGVDATAKVSAHNTATTGVHGIADTTVLETQAGAQAKASAAQAAAVASSVQKALNLADLGSASNARANLGLGNAATRHVGTAAGTVAAGDDPRFTDAAGLQPSENLSDLDDPAAARTNLELGGAATRDVGTTSADVAAGDAPTTAQAAAVSTAAADATAKANAAQAAAVASSVQKASNLSDLGSAATARTNLGLGDAATRSVGTGSGNVAAGDAPAAAQAAAIAASVQRAGNLSDLANASTARTNLGLGDAATRSVGTGSGNVAAGDAPAAAQAAATSAAASDATTKANAAQAAAIAAAVQRSAHTGTQETSTVTGLDTALAVRPGLNWLVATDAIWGGDPYGTNPKAALAAATAGQTVYFPPGVYTAPSGVGNGYTVMADDVRIVAGRGARINVTTWGQPGIDCFNRSGIVVEGGLTVAYTGTRGTHAGSLYRGSAPYVNGCGVYINRDQCRVSGLRTIGMPVGVFLSSYNGTGASDRTGVGNTVADLEVEGANFGILWVGQKSLNIDGVYGHDDIDDSSGVNQTHVYYASGSAALAASDITISNVRAENIQFGQPFQLKYCSNIKVSNHSARNCRGLLNGIDLTDAQFTNIGGTGILANNGQGAITMQTTTTICTRVKLTGVQVTMATGVDERAVRLALADSEVDGMTLTTSRPVSPSNPSDYEYIITGSNTRTRGLTIRSRGAGHVRAIQSGIPGTNSPGMTFESFVMEGTVGLIDVGSTSTGVNVSYAPAVQQSIVTGSNYIGTLGGAATYTVSRVEHERTTAVSGGTSVRPNPYLETRSHFNVTDTTGFTIQSPLGGTPNVGTTIDVVITNSSGGTMGTVTWDAAYTLLAAYVKPVAGKSTFHRFRHDGTGWVEQANTLPAVPYVSVTGLTGATTGGRYVGTTASGAPATGTFLAGDWVNSLDGNFYQCTGGGSPGTWVTIGTPPSLNALAADALTTGEVIPRRDKIISTVTSLASGTMYLTYFTADKSEAINTLTAWTGSTAAAATPTLCRMGVYSVAVNGDLTALVASTANDTTLFAATNTAYPKATQATWNKTVGTRYATAILVVTGATMPNFHGLQLLGTGAVNTLVRLAPAIVGRVAGQTDLPASVTAGSIVGFQAQIGMQLS